MQTQLAEPNPDLMYAPITRIHENEKDLNEYALELDGEFAHIAMNLPTEVKRGHIGLKHGLCVVNGVGELRGTYRGEFVVRVVAEVEGYNGILGFYKDYELSYKQGITGGLASIDLLPTTSEMLADCPAPLSALVKAVRILRAEFDHVHIPTDHTLGRVG